MTRHVPINFWAYRRLHAGIAGLLTIAALAACNSGTPDAEADGQSSSNAKTRAAASLKNLPPELDTRREELDRRLRFNRPLPTTQVLQGSPESVRMAKEDEEKGYPRRGLNTLEEFQRYVEGIDTKGLGGVGINLDLAKVKEPETQRIIAEYVNEVGLFNWKMGNILNYEGHVPSYEHDGPYKSPFEEAQDRFLEILKAVVSGKHTPDYYEDLTIQYRSANRRLNAWQAWQNALGKWYYFDDPPLPIQPYRTVDKAEFAAAKAVHAALSPLVKKFLDDIQKGSDEVGRVALLTSDAFLKETVEIEDKAIAASDGRFKRQAK